MRRSRGIFNTIRMLGVFGFILVLAVIITFLSVFNIFLIDKGITDVHTHSKRSFAMAKMEYELLEQELAERSYLLHQDQASRDKFDQAAIRLDVLIAELDQLDLPAVEIAEIEADREKLRNDFATLTALDLTQEEQSAQIEDAIFAEEAGLTQRLDDLVFEAEVAMVEELGEVSEQNQRAVLIGVIGLIIFPLLAVWAFMIVSRLTQPLLSLTNAVVAIGGGRYRVELLDDVLGRGDGLGQLAKSMDRMADAIANREAALQSEAQELRQQLHEQRRRKLILTSAVRLSTEE